MVKLEMSSALVSAFYNFNDMVVQQQGKQRPSSLEIRQQFSATSEQKKAALQISRRHTTSGGGGVSAQSSLSAAIQQQPQKQPPQQATGNFYPMPPSPSEQNFPSGGSLPVMLRERAHSSSLQEEIESQQRKRSGERQTNSSRYKTELCRPFEENGMCKYGDKCQFAHGQHEQRGLNRHPKYKTEFCRTYHTIGFCPYGPRCHFIHDDEDKQTAAAIAAATGAEPPPSGGPNLGPASPIIDMAPSPFGSSLTPPTSPTSPSVAGQTPQMPYGGGGGDVFLFDDAPPLQNGHHVPLAAVCVSANLMAAEHGVFSMEAGVGGEFVGAGGLRERHQGIPLAVLNDELPARLAGISIPSGGGRLQHVRERGFHSTSSGASSMSSSGSSSPPSPSSSVDSAGYRARLPVFGFV